MNGAVIVAAGEGRRMGGTDKAFALLGRLPLFAYALLAFDRCPRVDALVLAVRSGLEGRARAEMAALGLSKPCAVVAGGPTRQDSALAGLRALPSGTVLAAVHDAARPFVSQDLIERCFASAEEHGSGVAARRATDTVKESADGIRVAHTLDRSRVWLAETPQVFRRDALVAAIEAAGAAGAVLTDDASAIERAGGDVRLVESVAPNMKITTPADLEFAGKMLLWEEGGRGHG